MKKLIAVAGFVLGMSGLFAQDKTSLQVEVVSDDEKAIITTIENGKKTVHTIEGEEYVEFLEDFDGEIDIEIKEVKKKGKENISYAIKTSSNGGDESYDIELDGNLGDLVDGIDLSNLDFSSVGEMFESISESISFSEEIQEDGSKKIIIKSVE